MVQKANTFLHTKGCVNTIVKDKWNNGPKIRALYNFSSSISDEYQAI